MRWWGWGDDEGAITLPDPALALLREELGHGRLGARARVELEEVELPRPGSAGGGAPRARPAWG